MWCLVMLCYVMLRFQRDNVSAGFPHDPHEPADISRDGPDQQEGGSHMVKEVRHVTPRTSGKEALKFGCLLSV